MMLARWLPAGSYPHFEAKPSKKKFSFILFRMARKMDCGDWQGNLWSYNDLGHYPSPLIMRTEKDNQSVTKK